MAKNAQFTFRISIELKKELERVAAEEGRSVAQICEVFLKAGTETYKKDGTKLVQRYLSQRAK